MRLHDEYFLVRESMSGAMVMVNRSSNGHFLVYSPSLIKKDIRPHRTYASYPGLRIFDSSLWMVRPGITEDADFYRDLRQEFSGKIWKPGVLADASSNSIWQDELNEDAVAWHIVCVRDHLFLACIFGAESVQDSDFTGHVDLLFDFYKFSSLVHMSGVGEVPDSAVLTADLIEMKRTALSQFV